MIWKSWEAAARPSDMENPSPVRGGTPVVRVTDVVSSGVKWFLGVFSALIMLGVGTLVTQTLRRADEQTEIRRQLDVVNANLASMTTLSAQRNADQDRRIDAMEREIELLNEQVRLLWRR